MTTPRSLNENGSSEPLGVEAGLLDDLIEVERTVALDTDEVRGDAVERDRGVSTCLCRHFSAHWQYPEGQKNDV
jgi:hypothetical protein